jgi:predicted N-acetyltransferase YhbS
MPDLLCSLVRVSPLEPILESVREHGITIRRLNPWEKEKLQAFIEKHFWPEWGYEASTALTHQPVTCFVAVKEKEILGFACYECTRKNYFGPMGVDESLRGKGVGGALFLTALYGLISLGYSYCIIGGAGPVGFYQRYADVLEIPFEKGRGIYDLVEDPSFGLRRDDKPGDASK